MKLLVTGGAGFIGSNFIKYILNIYPDYKIINLDALTYCGNSENLSSLKNNPNYEFIHGNICDKYAVNDLIKSVDCVINFAAESHVDNSINYPELFVKTNINGTLNLLQAAQKHGIERFIQISTDEVYGSIENGFATEETPINPSSPYSAAKAGADMLAKAYFETYKLPILITRCSNNYGEFQYPEKLIPFFISRILKNENVTLYGDGLNIRDWIYVKDHCAAIDLVLHKGKIGEIYNIGSNTEKSNLEITKIILDKLNKPESLISFVEDRPGHDRRYALSCSKIQQELGWKPQTKFQEGILKTINWYLDNQNWLNNINRRNAKDVKSGN